MFWEDELVFSYNSWSPAGHVHPVQERGLAVLSSMMTLDKRIISVGMGACLAVELFPTHGLGQYPLSKLPVFHLLFPSWMFLSAWPALVPSSFSSLCHIPFELRLRLFWLLTPASILACCLGKALAQEAIVWLLTFSYFAFCVCNPEGNPLSVLPQTSLVEVSHLSTPWPANRSPVLIL